MESLSNLMRMGIGITAPHTHAMVSRDTTAACAWGAAEIAYGRTLPQTYNVVTVRPAFLQRPYAFESDRLSAVRDIVIYMNDALGIDRRYIADFVKGVEDGIQLKAQLPAVVVTPIYA